MEEKLKEYEERLKMLHLPRYSELPDIELYMDQLIIYITRQLEILQVDNKENVITTAMVNNYVKSGVLAPTIKKKYSKNHIAYLLVVCVFKQIYPISKISRMIEIQTKIFQTDVAYDYFCQEFENALVNAFAMEEGLSRDTTATNNRDRLFIRASVTAFAQKHLVEKYLEFKTEEMK